MENKRKSHTFAIEIEETRMRSMGLGGLRRGPRQTEIEREGERDVKRGGLIKVNE